MAQIEIIKKAAKNADSAMFAARGAYHQSMSDCAANYSDAAWEAIETAYQRYAAACQLSKAAGADLELAMKSY